MPGRKFGHNSPYDESGMPMGTTYADYDNADDVRKNQVKSTYVEPIPLNDPEYQSRQISKKIVGQDSRRGLPHGVKGFNSALADPDVPNMQTTEIVDIEDPTVRKEMLVQEAVSKGFDEVPELPKSAKDEEVDPVKDRIDEEKGEDFLASLEEDTPDKSDEVKVQEAKQDKS